MDKTTWKKIEHLCDIPICGAVSIAAADKRAFIRVERRKRPQVSRKPHRTRVICRRQH